MQYFTIKSCELLVVPGFAEVFARGLEDPELLSVDVDDEPLEPSFALLLEGFSSIRTIVRLSLLMCLDN